MARYIDADTLQKAVTDLAPHPHDQWETIGVWHIIEHMPTLTLDDLRPKGRWNIVEIDKATNRITIECPKCGMVEEVPLTTYGLWRDFCPSCGADMRGGDTR